MVFIGDTACEQLDLGLKTKKRSNNGEVDGGVLEGLRKVSIAKEKSGAVIHCWGRRLPVIHVLVSGKVSGISTFSGRSSARCLL